MRKKIVFSLITIRVEYQSVKEIIIILPEALIFTPVWTSFTLSLFYLHDVISFAALLVNNKQGAQFQKIWKKYRLSAKIIIEIFNKSFRLPVDIFSMI